MNSIMKILVSISLTTLFLIAGFNVNLNEQDKVSATNQVKAQIPGECVRCEASTNECIRVIIGNEVVIFEGNQEVC